MKRILILFVIAFIGITGCTKYWEDHYNVYPEKVNKNLWDVLESDPMVSDFVQILKDFQYDTLFQSDKTYTIFAPTNSALSDFLSTNEIDTMQINYLIAIYFIQSEDIYEKRKIQTLQGKFALIEKQGDKIKFDGIPIEFESPLCQNGKYFILDEVAKPKPSLFEYFQINNPVLNEYINSLDSIVLDKENSKPIGFDENGNTVYDTVSIIYNEFEEDFFRLKEEFRNKTATIVFPKSEEYQAALTEMAINLDIPGYTDYSYISKDWQDRVLIPYLLKQGVFENMLEPEEFLPTTITDTFKLKNIKGDSIPILYTPSEKVICSNGYAYSYKDFSIPDSLYLGTTKFEGERLIQQTGVNTFTWKEGVNVQSDEKFEVKGEYNSMASNDSILSVLFPSGYSGNYSVEFNTDNLFPRKYILVVTTHMYFGGVYDIYVNDKLVKTFDYYDYVRYRGLLFGVSGERYFPQGNYNKFDMWVDNIEKYGSAKIRFEYKGPGNVSGNGFIIDYIEFIPAN